MDTPVFRNQTAAARPRMGNNHPVEGIPRPGFPQQVSPRESSTSSGNGMRQTVTAKSRFSNGEELSRSRVQPISFRNCSS